MKHQTLKEFLKENNISVIEFSRFTGVSIPHSFRLAADPNYNIEAKTARKIAAATLEKYGVELDVIYIKNK